VLIVTTGHRLSGHLPTEVSPDAQPHDLFGTADMDDPLGFSSDP
jgi:hypothetical protein